MRVYAARVLLVLYQVPICTCCTILSPLLTNTQGRIQTRNLLHCTVLTNTQGFNKIYNWNLANSLKRIFLKHQPLWRSYQGPGQPERVPEVTTIREFDEAITVHSFGEGLFRDRGSGRNGG